MTHLLKAGLELIVVGGGHNNCYPIIRAAATHSGRTNPLGPSIYDIYTFLPAARYEHAGLHVDFVLPPFLPHKRLKEASRAQRSTGT